ncbi:transposase IS116/IS110/IS902 family protein [Azoarcus sp. CIB]|uniref:IS110 family transposase n=1 Tax=Aromatoleum sp. (strain CIB) TaxID=198107 RepID=UPI00067D0AEC|nr:IS110 family transposase [Azoarcus sp. CIB]AKU11345.1 transposase IS116/IS110/IS902 family protein [Azoarcus sp. CIB]
MNVVRIGLDIAKSVFQVHGVDPHGKPVIRKTLSRSQVCEFFARLPRCLVGLEACAGSHYWARELGKLGHDARLMAGQFVSPYRKSGKNDANDAEAICEAVGRPNMRFVPVKSEEAQAVLTVHRARALTVSERTALVNQVRGLLGEFGIVTAAGVSHVRKLLAEIGAGGKQLPILARETMGELHDRLRALDERILAYDRKIEALARQSEPARRLMAIEGIGPITASALVASVGNARTFTNGRQFAAWLGLTPRQNSSGGKAKLGAISKRGDVVLRTLLIHGTRSVLRLSAQKHDQKSAWAEALKARSCANVAAVALAAMHAHIIWAMLARGTDYRSAAVSA